MKIKPFRRGRRERGGAAASHAAEPVARESVEGGVDAAEAAEAAERALGYLAVESGPQCGSQVELGEATSIGRSAENDLVLGDTAVSRSHACIERRDGAFVLTDRDSTNGCWLVRSEGRERLEGPHTLSESDLIQVGPYLLRFSHEAASAIRDAA